MSTYDLTVSQNIRAIYFLAFVPIFGFGATTKTYVAQYMDIKDRTVIPKIVRRIQFLIMIFLLLRSEEHTSELQSRPHLVCRLLLEKKKNTNLSKQQQVSEIMR